jgi:hypothetical protein
VQDIFDIAEVALLVFSIFSSKDIQPSLLRVNRAFHRHLEGHFYKTVDLSSLEDAVREFTRYLKERSRPLSSIRHLLFLTSVVSRLGQEGLSVLTELNHLQIFSAHISLF